MQHNPHRSLVKGERSFKGDRGDLGWWVGIAHPPRAGRSLRWPMRGGRGDLGWWVGIAHAPRAGRSLRWPMSGGRGDLGWRVAIAHPPRAERSLRASLPFALSDADVAAQSLLRLSAYAGSRDMGNPSLKSLLEKPSRGACRVRRGLTPWVPVDPWGQACSLPACGPFSVSAAGSPTAQALAHLPWSANPAGSARSKPILRTGRTLPQASGPRPQPLSGLTRERSVVAMCPVGHRCRSDRNRTARPRG